MIPYQNMQNNDTNIEHFECMKKKVTETKNLGFGPDLELGFPIAKRIVVGE